MKNYTTISGASHPPVVTAAANVDRVRQLRHADLAQGTPEALKEVLEKAGFLVEEKMLGHVPVWAVRGKGQDPVEGLSEGEKTDETDSADEAENLAEELKDSAPGVAEEALAKAVADQADEKAKS